MNAGIVELSDRDFGEFVSKAKKAVVEFWDPWCSICAEMAPVYEELAKKYRGRASFAKLNMRENRKKPDEFEVYVTPTFIFFSEGKEVHRAGGLIDPKTLEEELEKWVTS